MPPQKVCSPECVRTELKKVLSSRGFARNDRLSGFLRFVVEQELSGRGDELKESIIGVEFFGRPPDYDYFADGLTGEIIRNLSIIDGLAVRSQTSSFAFKGKQQNVHEVGKQLDAEYVLEGSVLLSGQQLRISAQLIRVRDDYPLWSGKYDRELTDVFAIQDEISRGIVNGLRLKLGHGRRRYETSTEAYDLYLRARTLQIQHGDRGLDQRIGLLEEAIAKDT